MGRRNVVGIMHVSKINEVFLKIDKIDNGIDAELKDYFTFDVPNARWMPQFRNRTWDGKIRLFDQRTGRMYVGLLPYLIEFCKKNKYQYELEGIENERNVMGESVRGFAESLKLTSRGKQIEVRDYQLEAVRISLSRSRVLLLSPTASGKSLIIYCLVRYFNIAKQKILILVPTTSLVEQMYSDFVDYGWSEKYLHRVYAGHDRQSSKPVIISTWQSIYKMPKPYFDQFGCVIGDEAHLFKAKSLTSIMTKLNRCKYRFGFTGTLDGLETNKLILEGLFGQVASIVTTKELIDNKTLSSLSINCVVLKHTAEEIKQVNTYTYAEEMNYLVSNKRRNEFIARLCKIQEGNTLCLFQYVEKHGEILYNLMKDFKRKVYFVYGATETKTREDIRGIVENEKDAIIIASYGTFSTGINIRSIHNIVFASPSKSKIRVLQSIGRGLRHSEGKMGILVFDLSDNLSTKKRKNYTYRHFEERLNIYKQEKLMHKIDKVTL